MEDFNGLDLRPSQLGSADIIGDAYEYMIAMFASDAGKKGGEFFTPSQVSELVASLVQPKENDRIYDPTCGSGGLLLKAYKKVPSGKVAVYGQELNAQTWALCTMNMFLHGVDDARIWQGDTLSNPQNVEDDKLMKFQVVVANPPFSLDKWDSGFLSEAEADSKGKKKCPLNWTPTTVSIGVCLLLPKVITPLYCICWPVWMQRTAAWQWCFPTAFYSAGPARGKSAVSW